MGRNSRYLLADLAVIFLICFTFRELGGDSFLWGWWAAIAGLVAERVLWRVKAVREQF